MEEDIVQRLNRLGDVDCPYGCDAVGYPAANEIERLRLSISELRKRLEAAEIHMLFLTEQARRTGDPLEVIRMSGKREGIALALDYARAIDGEGAA